MILKRTAKSTFLDDLLGVTQQLLSFQTIASLCRVAMEKKYTRGDNLNSAKLVVLWKFRFTSGAHHKQGWVEFQRTSPGLCTIFERVPFNTTGLTESTVAGRSRPPARHKVAAVRTLYLRNVIFYLSPWCGIYIPPSEVGKFCKTSQMFSSDTCSEKKNEKKIGPQLACNRVED